MNGTGKRIRYFDEILKQNSVADWRIGISYGTKCNGPSKTKMSARGHLRLNREQHNLDQNVQLKQKGDQTT